MITSYNEGSIQTLMYKSYILVPEQADKLRGEHINVFKALEMSSLNTACVVCLPVKSGTLCNASHFM